jgi:hypothetical protein
LQDHAGIFVVCELLCVPDEHKAGAKEDDASDEEPGHSGKILSPHLHSGEKKNPSMPLFSWLKITDHLK